VDHTSVGFAGLKYRIRRRGRFPVSRTVCDSLRRQSDGARTRPFESGYHQASAPAAMPGHNFGILGSLRSKSNQVERNPGSLALS
jgi:hypothetical protein